MRWNEFLGKDGHSAIAQQKCKNIVQNILAGFWNPNKSKVQQVLHDIPDEGYLKLLMEYVIM